MSLTPYIWPRFMRVVYLKHYSNNKLVSECYDMSNMLHISGQHFLLSACFNTIVQAIPSSYYIGLDNRTLIQLSDNMVNLVGEPSGYGYGRQPVSSVTGWTITNYTLGVSATSPVVSFTASGGSYGPISNIFLTTKLDNTGSLIATAPVGGSRMINNNDIITMQLAVSLVDDPTAGSFS